MRRLLLVLLALSSLLAAECQRPVDPVDPGGYGGWPSTGGAAATGGAQPASDASVDGYALCVASVRRDPDRATQARDNGMTVDALAKAVCGFDAVVRCFADGVCQ